MQIARLYEEHRYLLDGNLLSENEKAMYRNVSMYMEDAESSFSINLLCQYLYRYYGKKVIVLLDEYDTPMQEAYVHGYWDTFTSFLRSLFNATFKSNPYLERAVLTGITRVSKQSIFSDLNNLNVITTTSEEYATFFGFTEQEVFQALEEFGLADKKELVKQWYDGFTFGNHTDIYNPWSITNYLDKKKIGAYWAATSSNTLINSLIQQSATDMKEKMEILLQEKEILVTFDEQIVFEQENLALAYLRASAVKGKFFSRISQKEKQMFREKLALLDMGLEDRMKNPVGLLSGGQRQALTLLMATVVTPKILLLDEHTAALDPATAEKVLNLTKRIVAENKITCLMITHNMQSALELGNRTLMMNSGEIVLDIKDEERKGLTVADLLEKFKEGVGAQLDNDRILLS